MDAPQSHYLPSNLKPGVTIEESLRRIGRECLTTVILGEGTVNLSGRVSRMQAMAMCIGNL
jgi:hypothetical protein